MNSPTRSVETEIITSLLQYLTACGLIKNFVEYKEKYGRVDPTFVEGNVIYAVEFREGYHVKKFLHEQKLKYLEKSSLLIINNLIEHWSDVIEYLVMEVASEQNID